jgi:hypothetical protein
MGFTIDTYGIHHRLLVTSIQAIRNTPIDRAIDGGVFCAWDIVLVSCFEIGLPKTVTIPPCKGFSLDFC